MSTSNTYILGQVILLTDRITNPSTGALTDDGTTACTVYQPDGTTDTPAVVPESTGIYTAEFTPDQTGWHEYVFRATNTAAGAGRKRFYVSPVP